MLSIAFSYQTSLCSTALTISRACRRDNRVTSASACCYTYNGGQLSQMTVNGKNVTFSELMEDEYLVVLKTSTKPSPNKGVGDYHFVVRLSNGTWADKPGPRPSRWNAVDGFANAWPFGEDLYYYNVGTRYFAVRKRR